jgi:cupin superfamily acireductone dioxygenase involved in methionine salvage
MANYNMFNIDISSQSNIENFVQYVNKKYPFSDVYSPSLSLYMKRHYHTGPEARLFLEGRAYFVLDDMEIECVPGTYVELDPEVPHAFYSNGPIKVIRFNAEYERWEATNIE